MFVSLIATYYFLVFFRLTFDMEVFSFLFLASMLNARISQTIGITILYLRLHNEV